MATLGNTNTLNDKENTVQGILTVRKDKNIVEEAPTKKVVLG